MAGLVAQPGGEFLPAGAREGGVGVGLDAVVDPQGVLAELFSEPLQGGFVDLVVVGAVGVPGQGVEVPAGPLHDGLPLVLVEHAPGQAGVQGVQALLEGPDRRGVAARGHAGVLDADAVQLWRAAEVGVERAAEPVRVDSLFDVLVEDAGQPLASSLAQRCALRDTVLEVVLEVVRGTLEQVARLPHPFVTELGVLQALLQQPAVTGRFA